MNETHSIKKFVMAGLVIALVIGAALLMSKTVPGTIEPSRTEPITMTGTMTCLPHKGNGMHTMECAYGIKDDFGTHYGLRNIPQMDMMGGLYEMGQRITISGTLTTGTDEKYDIVGTIDLAGGSASKVGGTSEIALRAGDKAGSFELKKVFADRVEGLNYMEYPVAREEGFPLTLVIGDTASNGCTVMLTLVRIEGDTAFFKKEEDASKPCPICLTEGTMISTPLGDVPVEKITEGTIVWSIDLNANKVIAKVSKVGKTAVPETHSVITLTLEDGRSVTASPRHEVVGGLEFQELAVGDEIEGSVITTREEHVYGKAYTYDILPDSPTGVYYANGILLESTLR